MKIFNRLSAKSKPGHIRIEISVPDSADLGNLLGWLGSVINRNVGALGEALKTRSDNSQVLTAINQLADLVKEIKMGLKEDFETLNQRFDGMESAASAAADDIAALKEEIKVLNEKSNVDLSGLVARAEKIEAGLRGAAGSQPGSDPEDTASAPTDGGGTV